MKNLLLFGLFLSFSLNAQIPTGAVGYWPFDGNAQDMSGNGSHGTVTGAIPAYDRFGQPNKAYKFDGFSSKIVVPHNNFVDIPNGNSFTFAYWQKTYSGNSAGVAMAKHLPGTWNGYGFTTSNTDPGYCTTTNHVNWYVASGAFQDACSNNPLGNDSTWHFIVGIYDGPNNLSYLYVDAVQQNDIGGKSGTTSNNANLSFGFIDFTNSNFFHGVLDGARLYNRILTQSEINALYNECGPGANPPAPVNTTPPTAICSNGSASLTATGTGTILWYTGPTTNVPVGSGNVFNVSSMLAGVHTWYAETNNGCGVSTIRTAISITVNPLPIVTVVASQSAICSGGTVNLTASGASTYQWNFGPTGNNVIVNPLQNSIYGVTGTDANGCASTASIGLTIKPSPAISIAGPNKEVCRASSVSLVASGALSYSWFSGQTTSVITVQPLNTQTFVVVGTNAAGCSSQAQYAVVVNPCTSIEENQLEFQLSTYPNPSNGKFNLSKSYSGSVEVTIFDQVGRAVYTAEINEATAIVETGLSSGVYVMRVRQDSQDLRTIKLIIQN